MDDGLSVRIAYFIKVVRDSLPTTPPLASEQETYVDFVGKIRDAAMSMKKESEIESFYDENIGIHLIRKPHSYYVEVADGLDGMITNKMLKNIRHASNFFNLDRDIRDKMFCYSEDEKLLRGYEFFLYDGKKAKLDFDPYNKEYRVEIRIGGSTYYGYSHGDERFSTPDKWEMGTWFVLSTHRVFAINFATEEDAKKFVLAGLRAAKALNDAKETASPVQKRKTQFIPPQLESIRFDGADYRHNRNVDGNDYLSTFAFRGGEFGTWMSQQDRQVSLNMGFESLIAMAKVLNISIADISLGGRLAIAFGARGSGGANAALAHYEPLREVINLTKMKGAGSLAHEWAHSMDDILNKAMGADGLATKTSRKGLIDAQKKLHDDMTYKVVHHDEGEVKSRADSVANDYGNKVRDYIKNLMPDGALTPEQVERRDTIIDGIMADRSVTFSFGGGNESDSIKALSEFKKEITGHVMPSSIRSAVANYVASYNMRLKQAANASSMDTREKTQYLKDSEEFDKNYSKTDHGYWASTCEMFARAFACYVHDKCTEAGITADYIVGHAETGPIPHGEERKLINEDFDKLIDAFKELGYLHDFVDLPLAKPVETKPSDEYVPTEADLAWATGSFEQVSLFG